MNIPLPNPPTDNLYKFIAIAGLVIFGVSLIAPHVMTEQAYSEYLDRLKQSNERVYEIRKEFEAIRAKSEPTEKQVNGFADAIYQEIQNFYKYGDDRERMVDEKNKSIRLALWPSFLASLVGLAAWFWQVQRHQDALAKYEADLKKKQLEQEVKKSSQDTPPEKPTAAPSAPQQKKK